jgi:hypothetical protein
MAEIIILAERRKARHERRATNVMAMSFELMAAYMFFGAAAYGAIVEASQRVYVDVYLTASRAVATARTNSSMRD